MKIKKIIVMLSMLLYVEEVHLTYVTIGILESSRSKDRDRGKKNTKKDSGKDMGK